MLTVTMDPFARAFPNDARGSAHFQGTKGTHHQDHWAETWIHHTDQVRGSVYDVATGALTEVS